MDRDWREIRTFYEAGNTLERCRARFGFSEWEWHAAVGRGDVVPRGVSSVADGRRRAVTELRDAGWSYAEIAAELGVSKATVAYHARRAGEPVNPKCARRYDWDEIQRAVDAGMSRLECMAVFGCSSYAWNAAVKRGALRPPPRRAPLEELLVEGRPTHRGHLRARLVEAGLKQDACEYCGVSSWRGRPLSLSLHHVNGVGDDNRLENLEILCPNCHSQTPNFGSRNRSRSRRAA